MKTQIQGRQPLIRSRPKTSTSKVQENERMDGEIGPIESAQAPTQIQRNPWMTIPSNIAEAVPVSSSSATKQYSNDVSANSNGQRRVRHSVDHFATLHQTPQHPIVGISGSQTPLTQLVQKRQFELTQLPKSQSAVTNDSSELYTNQLLHQHHLNNPTVTTSQNIAASSKKMARSQN